MSSYISRKALISKLEKHYCASCKRKGVDFDVDRCRSCVINSVLEKIRRLPAADVAPMYYGKRVIRNKKKNTAPKHEAEMDE